MKFEKPIIEIQKFDVINCLEGSSIDPTALEQAQTGAENITGQAAGAGKRAVTLNVDFTF